MGKIRRSTLFGLTLSLLFVAGCKVSCTTANISSLKFSKDEAGTAQAKEFGPGDTVNAIATVSNNGSKVTLKFRLFAEKVEGKPENTPVSNSEMSVDVDGDGRGIYYIKPQAGLPPGRYRLEVGMIYNGEEKDKKSDTFTMTGGGGTTQGPATAPSPPARPTPKEEDETEESENSSPDSNN